MKMGSAEQLEKLRQLREEFRAAHAKGTAALTSGDYNALSEAIDAERKLIDQQKLLVDAHLSHKR